jgi:hypothetical protein
MLLLHNSKKRSVRFRTGLYVAVAIAITGYSCRDKGGKDINQGEIHYAIEYGGDMGSYKDIMPKTLIVSFKDDKILFDISAPIGNSGILNLSNPEKGIFDTYISLLSWRYYYAAKPGETPPGFDAMAGMDIRKSGKTSVICGFNCKSAEVTFPKDRSKVYEIWYTDEIDIKNPNIANPFAEIDGVMMSFFFFMGDAQMFFNAETVYNKEIPDKTFERKEKYQRISKEQIGEFMDKLISL